ncbi:MAG TPA: GNAT family N-acetyltransferase [Candidatus Rubrimentiphilum sp.]|nr:GNAT family N-acetyltransferase [Candidatus Rubrimentiphilum sp.]
MPIPGFTIRAATLDDAAAIAGVQVRTWHAAYAGMLPQEHLDRRTVELRTAQWNQRLRAGEEDVFVACDPRGSVVGFATGLASSEPVDGFDGEIGAIYVLPEAQARGLGKRLLSAVGTALRAKGFQSAWLRVLSDNLPARRFYETLGAEIVCETTEEIDGFEYREHFYGWRDLSTL